MLDGLPLICSENKGAYLCLFVTPQPVHGLSQEHFAVEWGPSARATRPVTRGRGAKSGAAEEVAYVDLKSRRQLFQIYERHVPLAPLGRADIGSVQPSSKGQLFL